MTRKLTIKDIAKLSGVSTATVSRVINNVDTVNEEFRAKVESVIKKHNYIPNTIARSLKTSTTKTIAFVVSNISDYFFTTVAKGAENYFRGVGYNLIVCNTGNEAEFEIDYLNILQEKNVDGIILNTTGKNSEYIASISENLPIVLSSRAIKENNFKGDFIDFENISGVFEITEFLIKNGHSQIGVINGPIYLSTFQERLEGFNRALAHYKLPLYSEDAVFLGEGFSSFQDGFDGAKYFHMKGILPSALVIMNSEMAFGAYSYFKEQQIEIPAQLSIVSFGDMLNKDLLYIKPTISYTNLFGIGEKIGELMIERIESNNKVNNREIRYTTKLEIGDSVKVLN